MEETGSLCGCQRHGQERSLWEPLPVAGCSAVHGASCVFWTAVDSGNRGRADPERNGMFSGMEQP